MDTKKINDYLITDYSINTQEAARFLVNLYFASGKKYNCSGQKIEQLLIIYQLWCIKYNKTGLLPSVYSSIKIGNCLFHLENPTIMNITMGDIIKVNDKQEKEKITDSIEINKKVPKKFQIDETNFPSEVKELLMEIFITFGSFSLKDFFDVENSLIYLIKTTSPGIELLNLNLIHNELKEILFTIQEDFDNEINSFINKIIPKKTNEINPRFDDIEIMSLIKNKYCNMTFEQKKELLIYLGIIEDDQKNSIKKKVLNLCHKNKKNDI